jgi:transposase
MTCLSRSVGRPSKLTPEQVREIREWYRAVQALPSAKAMARKLKIGTGTLYGVALGLWHKRVA